METYKVDASHSEITFKVKHLDDLERNRKI